MIFSVHIKKKSKSLQQKIALKIENQQLSPRILLAQPNYRRKAKKKDTKSSKMKIATIKRNEKEIFQKSRFDERKKQEENKNDRNRRKHFTYRW